MTDSFRSARGRRVVSRATAVELGVVAHLLATLDCHRVGAVIIGRGRKAQLVDWDHLSGFGADAVMVLDESALRSPLDDREQLAANGKLELLGARTLTDAGNEMGVIDDITFDSATGALEALAIGDRQIPAGAIRGAGSYAVVIAADLDPA